MWSGNEVITFRFFLLFLRESRNVKWVLCFICFCGVLSWSPMIVCNCSLAPQPRETLSFLLTTFFSLFAAERSADEISLLSPQPAALLPARMCNSTSEKWKFFVWTSSDFAFLSFPGLQRRLRSPQLHTAVVRVSAKVKFAFVMHRSDRRCWNIPRHLVTFAAFYHMQFLLIQQRRRAISFEHKKNFCFPWNF